MKKRMTFGEEIAQKEPPSVILDLQSVSQAPRGVGRCSYAAGWLDVWVCAGGAAHRESALPGAGVPGGPEQEEHWARAELGALEGSSDEVH